LQAATRSSCTLQGRLEKRAVVGGDGWQFAVRELVEATATLLGLWGEKDAVHLALLEELSGAIAVITLPCPDGKFPSVGAHHPAAIRLERTPSPTSTA
jgi:hypothetical protein